MRPRGSSGPESPRRAVLVYCCVRARRVCRTRPEGLQGDVTPSPDVILPVAGGGVYRCAGTAGTRQGAGAQTASRGDTTQRPHSDTSAPAHPADKAHAHAVQHLRHQPCAPSIRASTALTSLRLSTSGRRAGRLAQTTLSSQGRSISRTSRYRISSADKA